MKKVIFIIFFLVITNNFSLSTTLNTGVSPAIEEENNPEFIPMYKIIIENKKGGEIKVSENSQNTFKIIGKVIQPAGKNNPNGYTASLWAKQSRIAATSVNSIHIKVGKNKEIISIIPQEFYTPPRNYNSYFNPDSSIYTDIKAGEKIFGSEFAPYVGNKVYLIIDEKLQMLPENYIPQDNDKILILIERPKKYPAEIVFENRFGGTIKIIYLDREEKIIGEVLKPVCGVGRFTGSQFAYPGRIRANHCGVICISTSPYSEIGGFQIIPANHGNSFEMFNAKLLTQWMVVGPVSSLEPDLAGTAPLFSYFIKPDYDPEDIYKENWQERLLQRFIIQVKIKDGSWQLVPKIVGKKDDALKDITAVRILFPIYENFLK